MNLFVRVMIGNMLISAGLYSMAAENSVQKCRYSYSHSLLQVECQDLKLKVIPDYLSPDIKVKII